MWKVVWRSGMINSLTAECEREVQRGGTINSLTAECEKLYEEVVWSIV